MALSLFDFHHELDRQMLNNNDFRGHPGQNSATSTCMKMELKECSKSYELLVETPGLKKDELKVSCDNGVLMISAENKEEKISKEERVHFSERVYGQLCRQVRLPKNVDTKAICAKYESGILIIQIPKTEKTQTNLIRID